MDRERAVPALIACTIGMEMIDSTIVATALPAIARDFQVPPLSLSATVTIYTLCLAIFIPISGWAANRFGARATFQAAILIFLAGSLLCAFSDTRLELFLARALQGFGGSMMTPVGRLVIVRTVPKERLVQALALATMPALLGPMIGPPLGGFIVTAFDWRWIFLINIPLGLVGLVLGALLIPRDMERWNEGFDGLGFLMTTASFSMIILGIELASIPTGIPGLPWILMLGGGLVLWAYVRHARRQEAPVLDLSLFKVPSFGRTVLGGFLPRAAISAIGVLTPLMLQLAYGYSAYASGLVVMATAAGAVAGKSLVRTFVGMWGFKRTLVRFSVVTGLSICLIGLTQPDRLVPLTVVVLLVTGITRSIIFTTMQTLSFVGIDARHMSQATSVGTVFQQLSLSAGVSLGALLVHAIALQGFSANGHTSAEGYAVAFVIIGAVCASSVLSFVRLPEDAGADYVPKGKTQNA